VARGALDLAACGAQLELREVRARGEAGEVARAEHQLAVEHLHGAFPPRRSPAPLGDGPFSRSPATCRTGSSIPGRGDSYLDLVRSVGAGPPAVPVTPALSRRPQPLPPSAYEPNPGGKMAKKQRRRGRRGEARGRPKEHAHRPRRPTLGAVFSDVRKALREHP